MTRPLPPLDGEDAAAQRWGLLRLAVIGPLLALSLFILWNLRWVQVVAPKVQMTPALLLAVATPVASPTGLITGETISAPRQVTQSTVTGTPMLAASPSPTATVAPFNLPVDGVLVSVTNTLGLRLVSEPGWPIVHPVALAVADGQIFLIDSGRVYAAEMPANPVPNAMLSLRRLLAPGDMVETLPVKEPVDLAIWPEETIKSSEVLETSELSKKTLLVLDKSNDVYRLDLASGIWTVEQATAPYHVEPDPHYVALVSYNRRLYLLDTARDNIWRHPADAARPANYLPTTWKPWDLEPGWPDVTHGIDLAVDGDVHVLTWEGTIRRFSGIPAIEQAGFAAWLGDRAGRGQISPEREVRPEWGSPYVVPAQGPLALATTVELSELYVLDPDAGQVLVLDKVTGEQRRTLVLRLPMTATVSAFAVAGQTSDQDESPLLYLAAGDALYVYPGSPSAPPTPMPVTEPPDQLRPNDARVLDLLAGFQLPLAGVPLGYRAGVYPGARRAYRYGVHEGHDFYSDEKHSITVTVGTPVLAAQAGRVIRADVGYRELTPGEFEAVIEASRRAHATSPEDEDRLRGRQVWIDHGHGIVTRYAHLSGIAEGIITGTLVTRGRVIGYVGLSGTADGVYHQGGQFAHLHFEIRIGDYYLGQWLSVPETMRWWWRVFEDRQ